MREIIEKGYKIEHIVLHEQCSIEEKGIDELITITGIGVEDILTDLTTLELKGIIKQVGGDRYKKS